MGEEIVTEIARFTSAHDGQREGWRENGDQNDRIDVSGEGTVRDARIRRSKCCKREGWIK